ncbi:MAG: ribosome small subunit-dependent GTPase A [Candidatus Eisenbacteria bacterium]
MEFSLASLGWNARWAETFEQQCPAGDQTLVPGRVGREDRDRYLVFTRAGEVPARLSGKLRHAAPMRELLPVVGDWVALRLAADGGLALVEGILPRRSSFGRRGISVEGRRTGQQVLAANFDTVFLVSGLNEDFQPRRIERYLTIAWDSGARPVIILNKADLCADVARRRAEVEPSAAGVPILAMSAVTGEGLEALDAYLAPEQTVIFLGSSGVGKSSLINRLLGDERQETMNVRAYDGRGRHATTAREMFLLSGGAVLIDTPGLRQIQAWGFDEGLERVFDDIEALAEGCRFRDCRHDSEPGCAVKQAVADGALDARRLGNYLRLQREDAVLAVRRSQRARMIVGPGGKRLR